MSQAVTCPVCGGKGKLPDDGKSTAVTEPICHGCGGTGWVEVGKNETPVGNWPWPNPDTLHPNGVTYTSIYT